MGFSIGHHSMAGVWSPASIVMILPCLASSDSFGMRFDPWVFCAQQPFCLVNYCGASSAPAFFRVGPGRFVVLGGSVLNVVPVGSLTIEYRSL
jgi:hypothetical protein